MGTPYTGGCLCGSIRYEISAAPDFPHFCSCKMCQKWSGAPVVAWVDFPHAGLKFTGAGGQPTFFRSSKNSQRGFCPTCGGAICAIDDDSDTICMTVATLDDPNAIVPESYSYPESAPSWMEMTAKLKIN